MNVSDPAAGASDDWYRGGLGTRYSYTTELRDTGLYGFLLPPKQVGENKNLLLIYFVRSTEKKLMGHMGFNLFLNI